jgi:phosphate transport system substrate-binding protein
MKREWLLLTGLVAGVMAVGCTEGTDSGSGGDGDQAASASERDQIRVVGSSTVYPFASYVGEELGATTDYTTPVIESTGSGGGMKLFCAGDGMGTPDITNASRRIKSSELQRCLDNGVDSITEFKIGLDGIVMAQAKGNESIDLTLEQIVLAVAAKVPRDGELVDNPHDNWSDIDSALPDREITIYGPPTTSGTRDAFEDLVMEAATEEMAAYNGAYTEVRQDGAFVPSGENDNLMVQKIEQDTDAFGVFGYSFLEENRGRIEAATVEGVAPKPAQISSGAYPVSRSLFFYSKNSHFGRVAGMAEYVEMFVSDTMIGSDGLLRDLGLIALPQGEREALRQRLEQRPELTLEQL